MKNKEMVSTRNPKMTNQLFSSLIKHVNHFLDHPAFSIKLSGISENQRNFVSLSSLISKGSINLNDKITE